MNCAEAITLYQQVVDQYIEKVETLIEIAIANGEACASTGDILSYFWLKKIQNIFEQRGFNVVNTGSVLLIGGWN